MWERARRYEDPSLAIGTQSVRAAAGVPKTTTGLDANKKVSGRKRVPAASAHDNVAGTALLDQAAEWCGNRLEKALADQSFKDRVVTHSALLDIDVEVVRRDREDQGKSFVPQPRRWIVEQVNGTSMLHRRLAREYDHRSDISASSPCPVARMWMPVGMRPSGWAYTGVAASSLRCWRGRR
ncbi:MULTISPECIES: hypothetical protein [unclassified Streptomyces]|uniref:hypothetical protein n=1 Tax=unclassified Streptomyces TaxID=2593676 RepID=UPI002E18B194